MRVNLQCNSTNWADHCDRSSLQLENEMYRLTGHFSDVDPRKLIQWCLYGSHTVLAHHQGKQHTKNKACAPNQSSHWHCYLLWERASCARVSLNHALFTDLLTSSYHFLLSYQSEFLLLHCNVQNSMYMMYITAFLYKTYYILFPLRECCWQDGFSWWRSGPNVIVPNLPSNCRLLLAYGTKIEWPEGKYSKGTCPFKKAKLSCFQSFLQHTVANRSRF